MAHPSGRARVVSSLLVVFTLACGVGEPGLDAGNGDDSGMGPPPVVVGVPDEAVGPMTEEDLDGDGVPNEADNCPTLANADQRGSCYYPQPPRLEGDVVIDGVARIDWHRQMLGLSPVVEDDALSEGCRAHIAYLEQLSDELGIPQLTHAEDFTKPYASAAGNTAGLGSVLALGASDIARAVDSWMNTLYHRLPLIHPGLGRIGIAYGERYAHACVYYRAGTQQTVVSPHAVRWPPPDTMNAPRTFPGAERPCPTVDDPLSPNVCPASAAIATLSLHGNGNISAVSGELRCVDSGGEVPLFRIWYDGGPSALEQTGYVEGSIALVPEPGTALETATYEARVSATVGGQPREYRWRFAVAGGVDDNVACDALGPQSFFDEAIEVSDVDLYSRVCDVPDFFRLGTDGPYDVTVNFDPARGVRIRLWDPSRGLVREALPTFTPHRFLGVTDLHYLELRTAGDDSAPYRLVVRPSG